MSCRGMEKQVLSALWVSAMALWLGACGTADAGRRGDDVDSPTTVGLPVNVAEVKGDQCASECQNQDSAGCLQCIVDECKRVAGAMAAMCDRIADVSGDGGDNILIRTGSACTDLSSEACVTKNCSELCATDQNCIAACKQQLDQATSSTNVVMVVEFVCADACVRNGDDAACAECRKNECKAVCAGAPISDAEKLECAAQCDGLTIDLGSSGTCDLSSEACVTEICSELCATDQDCIAACKEQLDQATSSTNDVMVVELGCADACDRNGDDAACAECWKNECKAVCAGAPISDAEKLECAAQCDGLAIDLGSSGTCATNQATAAPSSVTVDSFGYGGAGCPVGFNDNVNLVLVDSGTALELQLPANTPPIIADATAKTYDRSGCMLRWSFANVPADRCWSVGPTSQSGEADVASGSEVTYDLLVDFSLAGTNQIGQTLSTSGPFTAMANANGAVCSDQGGGGHFHFDTSLLARRGSKASIGHIDRIPIRWFTCP